MHRDTFPKITERALDDLRRRLGVKITNTLPPWCHEATRDAIRHYAHGIGDDNPLWCDPEYAAGTRFGGIPQALPQPALPALSWENIRQLIQPATTIALLVDNSQSMSRRIDFVRWAAERLADTLRKQDKIIVVPFNKQLGAITGPTSDAKTIGDAIASMRAQGGTAILDGLMESLELFESAEGRRAVILITDGYDEHSAKEALNYVTTLLSQE